MDTHQLEFRVCQYISRKLKGIKIPQKRVCHMKMLKSVHIEVGDREMRRLVREHKKFPIRLTQRIKSVQAVIYGCNPEIIDLTRRVSKHNIFKVQLMEIMKK
eukprot:5249090-Ditylum_brightwellii.AAC.1